MSDTKGLEERLRNYVTSDCSTTEGGGYHPAICKEAADALAQARREREGMEAALRIALKHMRFSARSAFSYDEYQCAVNQVCAALSAPSSPSPRAGEQIINLLRIAVMNFEAEHGRVLTNPDHWTVQARQTIEVSGSGKTEGNVSDYSPREEEWGRCAKRWRHKKRGTTYIEEDRGNLQMAGFYDDQPVVVYRAESDGSLWIRLVSEFEDGRFELLDAAGSGRE